jgi:heavy metal sensor kinase
MTLVTRVSAFFLTALAVVLAACSLFFYVFASRQLTQRFDEQLHGVLHSIVAAIEVEPEEVKWQPLEHTIGVGASGQSAGLWWVVIGDGSTRVDASPNVVAGDFEIARELATGAAASVTEAASPTLPGWRFVRQKLTAPAPNDFERELDEFDEITVVVARSAVELGADLNRLALVAVALPLVGWLAAALVGRSLVRRALRPVLSMAEEARAMQGADFRRRLPVSDAGDELTELGVSFNHALDRLERSYESQRRFTGDAAHELRTPLTVLLGQIDVALRRERPAEEYRQTLGVLRDEAQELRSVLEALLFLARNDGDAAAPDSQPIALERWLPEHFERVGVAPRRDDFQIRIAQPATIVAQPALLGRLVDNLVTNAAKYSDPGSPIVVEVARDGAEVLLSVTDRGIGIATDEVASVFDPFYRSPAARKSGVEGVGLGLAIAGRIAALIGGRLECDSELGVGSRFTLRVPIAD